MQTIFSIFFKHQIKLPGALSLLTRQLRRLSIEIIVGMRGLVVSDKISTN